MNRNNIFVFYFIFLCISLKHNNDEISQTGELLGKLAVNLQIKLHIGTRQVT